jgi:hypothetical protein
MINYSTLGNLLRFQIEKFKNSEGVELNSLKSNGTLNMYQSILGNDWTRCKKSIPIYCLRITRPNFGTEFLKGGRL